MWADLAAMWIDLKSIEHYWFDSLRRKVLVSCFSFLKYYHGIQIVTYSCVEIQRNVAKGQIRNDTRIQPTSQVNPIPCNHTVQFHCLGYLNMKCNTFQAYIFFSIITGIPCVCRCIHVCVTANVYTCDHGHLCIERDHVYLNIIFLKTITLGFHIYLVPWKSWQLSL